MARRFLSLLAALGLAATLAAAHASAQHDWRTYANPRFGTTASYPADVFIYKVRPDANDGALFRSRSGAELRVFGSYLDSEIGDRPATYSRFLASTDPNRHVTYRLVRASLLVESGQSGRRVFYERYRFGPKGVLNALVITYPPSARAEIEPLIAKIGASLGGNGAAF